MSETLNKYRVMILENPEVPEVYLLLADGLSKEVAYELIEMYRDQGRNDLTLEEYYPDAERLGRNPDLH
jgi:hypothetical protein